MRNTAERKMHLLSITVEIRLSRRGGEKMSKKYLNGDEEAFQLFKYQRNQVKQRSLMGTGQRNRLTGAP